MNQTITRSQSKKLSENFTRITRSHSNSPTPPMNPKKRLLSLDNKPPTKKPCLKHPKPDPQQPPQTYCTICMESKSHAEFFPVKNCSHSYCTPCIHHYVETKIEANVTSIPCPHPTCKPGFLDPETCHCILSPATFERWGRALCEEMFGGSTKFYCPFKDCSALLINEGEESYGIKESECPHCFRLFCAQCKVPWHAEMSCEEFGEVGDEERGREDLMLRKVANTKKWMRCSKCKFYVEKIDGCMFVKCRCGHVFCYGCGTTMTEDHYCLKCNR